MSPDLTSTVMFHNVYEMSYAMTPPRHNRGLGMTMPAIDTTHASTGKEPASYDALPPTPPQSAHECRRPSLTGYAFSNSTNSASPFSCSSPTTPTLLFNNSKQEVFVQHSPDGPMVRGGSENYTMGCSGNDLSRQFAHVRFGSDLTCDTSASGAQLLPLYPPYDIDHFISTDVAAHGQWTMDAKVSHGLPMPTYSATTHDAAAERHAMSLAYDETDAFSSHALLQTTLAAGDHQPGAHPSTFHNQQVIMPSQIWPSNNYSMHQGYVSPEDRSDAATFGSNMSDFSTFGSFSSSSSGMMVDEPAWNSVGHFDMSSYPMPTRAKRPSRARRAQKHGKCSTTIENHNVSVTLEPGVTLREGAFVSTPTSPSNKPHACETCPGRFARSEHLQRHKSTHTPVEKRPFKCHIPLCAKNPTTKGKGGISRGDNATDHYKTHLKAAKTGRRNRACTWPELRDGIIRTYPDDEKFRTKTIDKLERWIDTHPDGAAQRIHRPFHVRNTL